MLFKLKGILADEAKPTTFGHCPISVTATMNGRATADLVIEHRNLEWRILQAKAPAPFGAMWHMFASAHWCMAKAGSDLHVLAGC